MSTYPSPVPRKVLVTGGAHRLGAQLCRTFAQAGWSVVCHYKQSEKAALELCDALVAEGLQARAVAGDLDSDAGRQALIAAAAQGGGVDCLVNNASSFTPDAGATFEPAAMRAQLETNLVAPLDLGRLLAAQPRAGAAACIIHVLDQKVFNLNPDYFSYTVSKLALERSVALQAQALAPRVRVCGVAPGLMYLSGPQSPANFLAASQANLMRTPTDPADVAQTCLFLASTPSITGTVISVDGGQHLVPLPRDIMFVTEELLKGAKP